MDVDVIVPWRGGCADRALAWAAVQNFYAAEHPDWRVVEAPPAEGKWVKASAVRPAVEASEADVIVVADADVWCVGLSAAAMAIVCGLADWAVPHRTVYRLNAEATVRYIATGAYDQSALARKTYVGRLGGGLVVASREALCSVPMDRRFMGWGQEDEAWGSALATILGPPWRGSADLIHLWHPPAERLSTRRGSIENWNLYRDYIEARGNPDRMRELVSEA